MSVLRFSKSDEDLLAECEVETFHSSGPGGQNVRTLKTQHPCGLSRPGLVPLGGTAPPPSRSQHLAWTVNRGRVICVRAYTLSRAAGQARMNRGISPCT